LVGCAAFAAFPFVRTTHQVETWANSETLWSNVIRQYPRNERAYVARGNARGGSGRVREAMSDLQTARALGSRRGSLYDGLGNAFIALGQSDSALAMYDRGLALEPDMPRTHYNRAVVYLRVLGRPADALADLDSARAVLPAQALGYHVLRGDAYMQMRRYREAAAEYDGAIDAGARTVTVFNNRAYCRAQLGDSTGAAADLRDAGQLSVGLEGAK
jgi:tetratricopeptide (TPR) repeat protein